MVSRVSDSVEVGWSLAPVGASMVLTPTKGLAEAHPGVLRARERRDVI